MNEAETHVPESELESTGLQVSTPVPAPLPAAAIQPPLPALVSTPAAQSIRARFPAREFPSRS